MATPALPTIPHPQQSGNSEASSRAATGDVEGNRDGENASNQEIVEMTTYYCNELPEKFEEFYGARYDRFRKIIEHEDNLRNHRMTWLLLVQSFLMAAFITSSVSAKKKYHPILYTTAAVGCLTALVSTNIMMLGKQSIEYQEKQYFKGFPDDAICERLHGHARNQIEPEQLGEIHLLPTLRFRSKNGCFLPLGESTLILAGVQIGGWIVMCILLATR